MKTTKLENKFRCQHNFRKTKVITINISHPKNTSGRTNVWKRKIKPEFGKDGIKVSVSTVFQREFEEYCEENGIKLYYHKEVTK